MQAQQSAGVEADEPGSLWLDRGPDRLEPDKQPLPCIGDAGRVWRNKHEPGTPRKRLAELHPGMDPERLSGGRALPNLLNSTRLGRKGSWSLQQLRPVAGGNRELKAWE
jgi:hypothetical protein